MTLTIVEAGPLSSVQDPFGRPGWRRYGVPVGGAADGWSARLANRLVGNDEAAALVEITLGGAVITFDEPVAVAVTGGVIATLERRPVPATTAIGVRRGSTLRVDQGDGARGYLAVGGGVSVQPVLGSRSTELRAGFGGFEGRALEVGDRLTCGVATATHLRWTGLRHDGPIRVLRGPHGVALDAMTAAAWSIGVAADRAGVRLDGPAIETAVQEVASMGLPIGAIQVPPDGMPIVMLVDRPVTGGYPVPAVVIRADIGRVAQLRTGDELRFASVSLEEAREAWLAAEDSLAALEPVALDDGSSSWAGSHR